MSVSQVIKWRRDRSSGAARAGSASAGFTIIEILVVLLIMAILMGIAIPTFLGTRTSTQDEATQADLNGASHAARYLFTGYQNYFAIPLRRLYEFSPQEPWACGGPCSTATVGPDQGQASQNEVAFLTPCSSNQGALTAQNCGLSTSDTSVGFAETSASGTCWLVILHSMGPTIYAKDPGVGCGGSTTLGIPALHACWPVLPPSNPSGWASTGSGTCGMLAQMFSNPSNYSFTGWPQ